MFTLFCLFFKTSESDGIMKTPLTAGMRVLHRVFPQGIITGSLPPSCLPSPPPSSRRSQRTPRHPPALPALPYHLEWPSPNGIRLHLTITPPHTYFVFLSTCNFYLVTKLLRRVFIVAVIHALLLVMQHIYFVLCIIISSLNS